MNTMPKTIPKDVKSGNQACYRNVTIQMGLIISILEVNWKSKIRDQKTNETRGSAIF